MPSERLAVYTTMYPGCEQFLGSWSQSWHAQTDRDCDLWIGLDGLSPSDVRACSEGPLDACWIAGAPGETPAAIRQRAFAQLVERYDKIVLVDADDILEPSRVASARTALDGADVAGCALRVSDVEGTDLGFAFGPEPGADLGALLARYNVFGLSNSAYRARALKHSLPVPGTCVLIDWLLATRASVAGSSLAFDPVPRMVYRQYEGNSAAIVPPFSGPGVLRAAALVAGHYQLLLETDWPWPAGTRQPYEHARARVIRFYDVMSGAPHLLQRYVDDLNELPPRHVWWWAVAHPELEHLWTH